ncbi:hypothetical protein ACFY2M_35070 [Streptomyces sp. NPDC001276]|uniref:hypothetical protein n=1 Tax=Streptomyces sp. NPDC001276 TaxID=3364555 RepID=UPI0036A4DB87
MAGKLRSDGDGASAVRGLAPKTQGISTGVDFVRGELALRTVHPDGGCFATGRGETFSVGSPLGVRAPSHLHVDQAPLLLRAEADLDGVTAGVLLPDVLDTDLRVASTAKPHADGLADVQVVCATLPEGGTAAPDRRPVGEVRLLVVAGAQCEQFSAPTEEDTTGEGTGTVFLTEPGRGLFLVGKEQREMAVGSAQHGSLNLAGVLFMAG